MSVTLKQINNNILSLKKELDNIKEMIEESSLELADDVKKEIEASRRRPVSEFKSQDHMEKKFV